MLKADCFDPLCPLYVGIVRQNYSVKMTLQKSGLVKIFKSVGYQILSSRTAWFLNDVVAFAVLFLLGLVYRTQVKLSIRRNVGQRTVIFGSDPIINNKYWSEALQSKGIDSKTVVDTYYSINSRKDFDEVWPRGSTPLTDIRAWVVLWRSLKHADWIVMPFSGFFFGKSSFGYKTAWLFRLFRTRVLIIPYGSDMWVYRRLRSLNRQFGLMATYPGAARRQREISRRLDYWADNADAILPSQKSPEGVGRWTVLTPSALCIDTDSWRLKQPNEPLPEKVRIVHTPNHRGYKGTEYLKTAVAQLESEGHNLELRILEGVRNDEVKQILCGETDILVEQLLSGYGLSAVEGMAAGVVVIANLEESHRCEFLDRHTYFAECPIVSATPETITAVLRELVSNGGLRRELSFLSREYATRYHSYDFFASLFCRVCFCPNQSEGELETLFDPSCGELRTKSPLKTPLHKHRLSSVRPPQ